MCLALTQTLTPALSRKRERGIKAALSRRLEREPDEPDEPDRITGIHPLSLWERIRVRVRVTRLHPTLA